MYIIRARNVNDAFTRGLETINSYGVSQDSRAGKVVVCPSPVATEYLRSEERVLFNSVRDANPVFHLIEALWFLAGRRDATFLDQFVHDFSERFAEPDGNLHGAYGYRWRQHFDLDGGSEQPLDQLNTIVELLRKNPNDRRIVLTMWDPMADLGADKIDVPCNTTIYFRVVESGLDMTVCCRSNDLWWGAYGSNSVTFSILQEYMARRIGIDIGIYIQFSNNFHYYPSVVNKTVLFEEDPYLLGTVKSTPVITDPDSFDDECVEFLETRGGDRAVPFKNTFLTEVVLPLWLAYRYWREKKRDTAYEIVDLIRPVSCDWRVATLAWMERRLMKGAKK